jgi:hypothetical protein
VPFLTVDGRLGQTWSTRVPEAFWRSFSEIDLANQDQVLRFVHRFGEPYGYLKPMQKCAIEHWGWLRDRLRLIALAWNPADGDGLSSVTTDPETLEVVQAELTVAHLWLKRHRGFESVAEPGTVTPHLRPKNLAAYMLRSAGLAFDRRVPMRICRNCGMWFEAKRRDVRTCSGSCRATFSQTKQKQEA